MALPVESIGTTHYSNVTTEIADTLDMSSMNTDLDADGNQSDKHIISFNRNQSTFQQLLHTLGNTHQHELEEQSREWRMKLEETQQQNKATEQQLHTITTECRQLRAELDHNQEQYRMEQLRLHDSLMEAQNRIKSLEKRPSYWPFDDKVSSSLLSLDFSHEHCGVLVRTACNWVNIKDP
ncbi:hypothetical protein BDF22DRAFT_776317 [Syncephalis plumigaleata]|nr:hypothetical protein BDF22DRAFT_776317 [Syncephalis plumigaleata]